MVQRILLNHYLARTAGMLSGARRASLMLLVMLLTTSTAWAQDPATIGSISYNNSISAYEINSVDNLNDLAVYVNGKGTYSTGGIESDPHTCSGLSFKMTAPITYDGSENNFTPIGNDSQSFDGTFDGQGKTISGININNNTSATYQAIFGSVQGTVKNLVVSNCSIVAYQQVGAIAGTIQGRGTIENCSVGNNVTLSGHSDIGGISGGNDGGTIKGCTCAATINGTEASGWNARYLGGIAGSASGAGGPTPYLTDNLFTGAIGGDLDKYIGAIVGRSNDASLTNIIYTSTGFGGIGAASSTTGADGFGASRPYSVTFDENGGTAVPDLEVALGTVISAPATTREGYTLTGWKNGSTDFDFSTPVTSDLVLTAQWVEEIPYIDENGKTAYCTNYTVLDNTMTTIPAGWYVVKNDVTFNGNLSTNTSSWANNMVNIILCDGATLTANNIGHQENYDHLCIYGQSQGTGTANISGRIESPSSLQIYGGTINVTGEIMCPQSGVGIYGGNVTAADINGHEGDLSLKGGTITVGSLTVDQGNITLGGATVKANSYNVTQGNVTILTGITYYDGTGASYTAGIVDPSAIEGKTLRTYDYRGGTCGKNDPATGDVDESQNVVWMLTGNTLTISGTGAMADYAEASGQPWTAMHSDIKAIVIEDGVTSIGNYAFSLCEYVTSGVSIPASVTSIGNYSFNYCSMTSLTILSNSSLETIGSFAFNCAGFGSVTIPASVKSIGNNAFDGSAALTTVTLNSNPFIGESAFYSSTAVTMNLTANGPVDGAYWTTFYNKNYNFEADANTQVFKAELVGTKITLHEVANRVVDAGEGVVLKTTGGGNPEMTLTTSASGDSQNNSLAGVSAPAGVTADGTMYVLNNGSNGVGFYKLTAGKTLGVGKAYLTYSGTTAPGFFGFDVDNENTTEVGLIDNSQLTIDNWAGAIYDLQGRKIANGQKPTAKGLYIVNGKKVMIK